MGVRMRFPLIFSLSLLALLTACSNLGGAVGSAAQAYWNSRNPASYAQTPLQPQFTYLEVLGPANSALMVLASVDKPLHQPGNPVETWVSGTGEVLRTQHGFVAGSTGISYLPETAQAQWSSNGDPTRLEFNMAQAGLSKVPMVWESIPVPAERLKKPGPLLQRAQKIPNLNVKAWIAKAEGDSAPRLAAYQPLYQLVATHPGTGQLVYGHFCVGGLAHSQCIEYLLRTAAQNL